VVGNEPWRAAKFSPEPLRGVSETGIELAAICLAEEGDAPRPGTSHVDHGATVGDPHLTLRSARLACALAAASLVATAAAGGTPSHRHGAWEGACRAQVHHDVLPVWMRAGFTGPRPRVPYVLGERGTIGAVLFGSPLNAPPAQQRNNKILWVPRRFPKTVAPLWIRLQLMDGDREVGAPFRQIVPTGPGPSIVDAPSAGCWRLTLSWSGQRDTLDLSYTPPD
jgi:hypothetical protein